MNTERKTDYPALIGKLREKARIADRTGLPHVNLLHEAADAIGALLAEHTALRTALADAAQ